MIKGVWVKYSYRSNRPDFAGTMEEHAEVCCARKSAIAKDMGVNQKRLKQSIR
jgi:hypothetical protein